MLCPSFVENVLFNKFSQNITEAILNIICDHDANIFRMARSESPTEQDEVEDLKDEVNNCEPKRAPTERNKRELLQVLAHEEIIKSHPSLLMCGEKILGGLINKIKYQEIRKTHQPTLKNVLGGLICTDEPEGDENATFNFL